MMYFKRPADTLRDFLNKSHEAAGRAPPITTSTIRASFAEPRKLQGPRKATSLREFVDREGVVPSKAGGGHLPKEE